MASEILPHSTTDPFQPYTLGADFSKTEMFAYGTRNYRRENNQIPGEALPCGFVDREAGRSEETGPADIPPEADAEAHLDTQSKLVRDSKYIAATLVIQSFRSV